MMLTAVIFLSIFPLIFLAWARGMGADVEFGPVTALVGFSNLTLAMFAIDQVVRLKSQLKKDEEQKVWDEALLSGLGEGIVVTDKEGYVMQINKKAEELVGWKNSEVVGKRWHEVARLENEDGSLIDPENRATQKVLKTGIPLYMANHFYVRRDGSRFPVGTTAAPVIMRGEVMGVIAVFRDITHEREVDRAKSEFVSLASHQLRTPLSAVKWFCEMLIAGDAGRLSLSQLEFVHNIDMSNERMIELVNLLLDISRIESGKIVVDRSPTDLRKLLDDLLSELKPKIKTRKVKLMVDKSLREVFVDPRLVRQVYANLLTNSIKYTKDNGVIEVIVLRKDGEIVSEVRDNGFGIPEADKKRVFEKFFRAENVSKIETDGTGLGLYLAKAIVTSSGGKMWFESKLNSGTSFWFSLPDIIKDSV